MEWSITKYTYLSLFKTLISILFNQGSSWYETLIVCNYAISGNWMGMIKCCNFIQRIYILNFRRWDVQVWWCLLQLPWWIHMWWWSLCCTLKLIIATINIIHNTFHIEYKRCMYEREILYFELIIKKNEKNNQEKKSSIRLIFQTILI